LEHRQSRSGSNRRAELLALAPDAILANGLLPVRTVPTVFTLITEPVAQGIVESLAHPGGNLTGFSYLAPTISGKWLESAQEPWLFFPWSWQSDAGTAQIG